AVGRGFESLQAHLAPLAVAPPARRSRAPGPLAPLTARSRAGPCRARLPRQIARSAARQEREQTYSTNSAFASGCAACQARRWRSSSIRTWLCLTDDRRDTSMVFGATCSATQSRSSRKETRSGRSAASWTRILIRGSHLL